MDLDDIRRKLTHGVPPLTLEEGRWLFQQVTGEQIASRKRCDRCEGEGEGWAFVPWFPGEPEPGPVPCPNCGGSGYK